MEITKKPTWVLTEELFAWMQLICKEYKHRETLADVAALCIQFELVSKQRKAPNRALVAKESQ